MLSAADAADVIVVCIGEETYTEKPGDIDDLNIAAGQSQVRKYLIGILDAIHLLYDICDYTEF